MSMRIKELFRLELSKTCASSMISGTCFALKTLNSTKVGI